MSKAPFSLSKTSENLIFTSGQVHLTKDGTLLEGSIKEKTRQVMTNLQKILEKEGANFEDVLKTTIYLTDMTDYAEVNEAYAEYFKDKFPAREAVCVKELPLGASIELSMIAERKEDL